MRVSVIVPDNMIVIDGESRTVDLSGKLGVHALQWSDAEGGHIEFSERGKPNASIQREDIDEYVALWNENAPPAPTPNPPPTQEEIDLNRFARLEKVLTRDLISGAGLDPAKVAEFNTLRQKLGLP